MVELVLRRDPQVLNTNPALSLWIGTEERPASVVHHHQSSSTALRGSGLQALAVRVRCLLLRRAAICGQIRDTNHLSMSNAFLQPSEQASMAQAVHLVSAHDRVVMHRDLEGPQGGDDLPGHLNVLP